MKVEEAIDKIENGKYYSIWQAEDKVLSNYVSIVDNEPLVINVKIIKKLN